MNNNKPGNNTENNTGNNVANLHRIVPKNFTSENNNCLDIENQIKQPNIIHPTHPTHPTNQTNQTNSLTMREYLQSYTSSFFEYMNKDISFQEKSNFWSWFIFFLIGVIIIISTIVPSYHYVKYDEYALRLNKYHGADLSKVYGEGRYFLTLENSMIYFPSTFQRVSFVSSAFSDNGLEFDLDVSFYYKLPKENLGTIYDTYSTSYANKIESNAKQVTKNIASTFRVEEFLSNRTLIEETIGLALQTQIDQTLGIYLPRDYFKIITITFPSILISKSLDTAIALQTNQIALLQQEVNIIIADTEQMISQIEASTTRIENYALTKSNQIKSNAQSISTNMLLTSRTDGLDLFCSTLNITEPAQINKINKIFTMIDNANNLTLFNTGNNLIYNV